jgi:enoyl-CoA hydratase
MPFETLLLETTGATARVTLNRPEKLNALTVRVVEELETCFRQLGEDAEVRVIILTGAGSKAFAAGADVQEIAALSPLAAREFACRGQRVFSLIENLGKPVIAAVNGFALGGGCELAMACSLRVASESARFGQPEVKLGLIPGYGGTQRLARLIGKGRALELMTTGEAITAADAFRIGLVNQVVPPEQLIAACEALAAKIIANAPLAVKFALEAVNHGMELPLDEGLFLEANLFAVCCSTEDMKEGTRAFLEKRPPRFTGK